MSRGNVDPVEEAAGGSADLYGVSTWEERTALDGVAATIYRLLVAGTRATVVALALLILVAIGGLSIVTDPVTGSLTALSALPALGLATYVWRNDVTASEPLGLLVATFLLGVLTANFAAVLNSVLNPYFETMAFLGSVLFFYLVVGPVEETVKLLAVRLHAYRDDRFDAVIDGAVYGAMAGLGFATIENALYISRELPVTAGLDLGLGLIGAGGGITAVRALAGPGHVIYSAFAGYYLGLAKFNPEDAGPIVIKGLLIAAFIHATYNTTVGLGSGLIALATGLPGIAAFLVYVLLYDGLFGYLLYRKIRRYRTAYRAAHDPPDGAGGAGTAAVEAPADDPATGTPPATGDGPPTDTPAGADPQTEDAGGDSTVEDLIEDGLVDDPLGDDSRRDEGAQESTDDTGEGGGDDGADDVSPPSPDDDRD